jgi:hypothetical protein
MVQIKGRTLDTNGNPDGGVEITCYNYGNIIILRIKSMILVGAI